VELRKLCDGDHKSKRSYSCMALVCGASQLVEDFVREVHAVYPANVCEDLRTTVTFVGRKHHNHRSAMG